MLKMEARDHTNGELRLSDVGKTVKLIGWVSKRRNLGSLVFIDLRDRYGYTQIVFESESFPEAAKIRNEYIIEVEGEVCKRQTPNPKLPTGEIEVNAKKITIINSANTTPFIIADEPTTDLDVVAQARILDLLESIMQKQAPGMLLVTHDMGVVARLADDVAVMSQGKIVEQGDVETLFNAPKHTVTRSLVSAHLALYGMELAS